MLSMANRRNEQALKAQAPRLREPYIKPRNSPHFATQPDLPDRRGVWRNRTV